MNSEKYCIGCDLMHEHETAIKSKRTMYNC